jgi:hypothetical protein
MILLWKTKSPDTYTRLLVTIRQFLHFAEGRSVNQRHTHVLRQGLLPVVYTADQCVPAVGDRQRVDFLRRCTRHCIIILRRTYGNDHLGSTYVPARSKRTTVVADIKDLVPSPGRADCGERYEDPLLFVLRAEDSRAVSAANILHRSVAAYASIQLLSETMC